MSHIEPPVPEEKPLDPAMEAVRRKMVRLQLVSAIVMFVSLMAVLGAVVYKATRPKANAPVASSAGFVVPSDAPLAATLALPTGFTVTSTSLSGGQVLFYGVLPNGQRKAIVFDIGVGRIVADIAITGN